MQQCSRRIPPHRGGLLSCPLVINVYLNTSHLTKEQSCEPLDYVEFNKVTRQQKPLATQVPQYGPNVPAHSIQTSKKEKEAACRMLSLYKNHLHFLEYLRCISSGDDNNRWEQHPPKTMEKAPMQFFPWVCSPFTSCCVWSIQRNVNLMEHQHSDNNNQAAGSISSGCDNACWMEASGGGETGSCSLHKHT